MQVNEENKKQVEEMKTKHNKAVDELRKKAKELGLLVMRNTPALIINRIPEKELEWFKKWAGEEFAGDYGMALKWMVQAYMPPEMTEVKEVLKNHETRILALEEKHGNNKENKILTGSGKEIGNRSE